MLLKEEWINSTKSENHTVEFFKNPTSKELRQAGRVIRFLAVLPSKTLYVWDHRMLHAHALNYLNLFGKDFNKYWHSTNVIGGIANFKKGKYVSCEAHNMSNLRKYPFLEKVISKDWSWVNKYIDINCLIKKVKKDILKKKAIEKRMQEFKNETK